MTQISKRPSSETAADVSEEEPQIPKPPDDQSAQAEQTEEETQAQDNQPPSIYDRLGGMEAITAAVDILYDRVFADPELVSFFVNANMKTLRKRQTQFLAQVLGGPKGYKGRNMPRAHRQLAIEQKQLAEAPNLSPPNSFSIGDQTNYPKSSLANIPFRRKHSRSIQRESSMQEAASVPQSTSCLSAQKYSTNGLNPFFF